MFSYPDQFYISVKLSWHNAKPVKRLGMQPDIPIRSPEHKTLTY